MFLSSHPGLLKRLFEQEVPEIYDGTVIVKSVAREAGDRSKISVFSENNDIDAVGDVLVLKAHVLKLLLKKLGGEKIDIVQWNSRSKSICKKCFKPFSSFRSYC
ncbi:hypothetical protein ACV56Z_03885 [Staphylococcus aureus]